MPRVITFYYVIYIIFISNRQHQLNNRHNLLSIEKFEKLYKFVYIL